MITDVKSTINYRACVREIGSAVGRELSAMMACNLNQFGVSPALYQAVGLSSIFWEQGKDETNHDNV
jgi:hypothetical protein